MISETTTLDCALFGDLWGSASMRQLFSTQAMVQAWLDAESALAHAEAEVGVIPVEAARRIEEEAHAELYDAEVLRAGIADSQHPLVPLIRALVERCGEHGAHVHWGATTQDIIDTGLVLQCRQGLLLLESSIGKAVQAAGDLAETHNRTVMAGRTHGQHAVPITFGLKAAGWTDELTRAHARLLDCRHRALCVQLGGAAGTLASLGADARPVLTAFARRLDLALPAVPWFVARDRLRDIAHALMQLSGAVERIAAEVIRLQATEVGELAEAVGDGHVGSSTMPQKRNPMVCEYVVASCRLLRGVGSALDGAVAHAGERDMALWAVEWLAMPQMFIIAGGVAEKCAELLRELEVDPERMKDNLAATGDVLMAEAAMMRLGRAIGHERAHVLVMAAAKRAQSEQRSLVEILSEDDQVRVHVGLEDLVALTAAPAYLGWAPQAAQMVRAHANGGSPHGQS